jgi:DNA-binding transcriptional ArsR family regulator
MKRGLADFRFRHMDYIPPELVPREEGPVPGFESELERIRSLPLEQQSVPILRNLTGAPPSTWERLDDPAIRAELIERASTLGSPTVAMVELGLERPAELVDGFLGFLQTYWDLFFREVWEAQLEELEEAMAIGRERVAEGGLGAMLDTLRPTVAVDHARNEFSIRRDHEQRIELTGSTPVLLIPSGFLWPHIGLVHDPPHALAIAYPARLGSPISGEGDVDLVALLRALGDRTRLQTLRLIRERPRSTQELAKLIGLSEPAMSRHLRQLAAAGVLESTRRGQFLLYSVARDRIEQLSGLLDAYLSRDRPDA